MSELPDDVLLIASRVRTVQDLLFGNRMRNDLRAQARVLVQSKGAAALGPLSADTRRQLLKRVVEDHTLADLYLARLARTKPHAMVILLALDSMNLSLMNPDETPDHAALIRHIASNPDRPLAPVGLVLRCLERFR